MDEAARVAAELLEKLAELNGKVVTYQRDMLCEFRKHMADRLRKQPDHVQVEVAKVIAEAMTQYKSLLTSQERAGIGSAHGSIETGDRNRDRDGHLSFVSACHAIGGRKSSQSCLYHTSGSPGNMPSSPREREQKFHGLFIPHFIPLLGSHEPAPPFFPPPTLVSSPDAGASQKAEDGASASNKLQTAANLEDPRPDPVRRLTPRSSSADSSGSEATKKRRSALRRSSSSVKASPRRVRFDIQGDEVLPSSSPQALTMAPGLTPSRTGERDADDTQTLVDTSTLITDNDPHPYLGLSLLEAEGEAAIMPRPKKVSSTQALRALTRNARDEDCTIWTAVNPEPDEPLRIGNWDDPGKAVSQSAASPRLLKKPTVKNGPASKVAVPNRANVNATSVTAAGIRDEEASDDEFLSMRPKLRNMSLSPARKSTTDDLQCSPDGSVEARGERLLSTPKTTSLFVGDDVGILDHEEVFDFDEDLAFSAPSKYIPDVVTDATSGDMDDLDLPLPKETSTGAAGTPTSVFGGSLPRPIRLPDSDISSASPETALFANSIGSYKGHILSTGPIKNPKLYQEIANMKDVYFFVGSVDGRSGVDPVTNPISFKVLSGAHAVSGATARSLSERMAVEEATGQRTGREEN